MNRFCTSCGIKLEQGVKFCTECGESVTLVERVEIGIDTGISKQGREVDSLKPKVQREVVRGTNDGWLYPENLQKERSTSEETIPAQVSVPNASTTASKGWPVTGKRNLPKYESSESTETGARVDTIGIQNNPQTSKRAKGLWSVVILFLVGCITIFLIYDKRDNSSQYKDESNSKNKVQSSSVGSQVQTKSSRVVQSGASLVDDPKIQRHVFAVVEAKRTKNETALDASLSALKSIPIPERGDRVSARASNAEGLTKLQANDLSVAVDRFRDGLFADPGDVEIANNLAYALSKMDREREAIPFYARAIWLAPDRTTAWAGLAVSLGKSGRLEEAVAAYLVAYKFSRNQEKTKLFLQKQSNDADNIRERELSQRVLQELD